MNISRIHNRFQVLFQGDLWTAHWVGPDVVPGALDNFLDEYIESVYGPDAAFIAAVPEGGISGSYEAQDDTWIVSVPAVNALTGADMLAVFNPTSAELGDFLALVKSITDVEMLTVAG